jgi:tetratricopeptide (TPR) repeat protein
MGVIPEFVLPLFGVVWKSIRLRDVHMPKLVLVVICLVLLTIGCGRKKVVVKEDAPPPKMTAQVQEVPERSTSSGDLKSLQELANRNVVNPEEAIRISNRLLQEDVVSVLDEQTLNNLEKMLLAALPQSSKTTQPIIQRNLGIVNFYNKKYNKARQALQCSNETDPRDARTHYYLACLFDHQAKIYSAKGEQTKAQRHQKRAQIEIETARKLEPGNHLYRKGLALPGD